MATKASRIALAGSNISSTGEVDADLLDNIDSAAFLSLDSSGRLLLGTSTEGSVDADDLTISGDNRVGMTIRSANSGSSRIYFSDGTSGAAEYVGYITYDHLDNHMRFGSGAVERMRIDSLGNLLVGTTDSNVANNSGSGNDGVNIHPDSIRIARTDGDMLLLNRLNSDGDIAKFLKDGAHVGSIGSSIKASSRNIYIGSENTGLYFFDGYDTISPVNPATGGDRDAAIDIGRSTVRFKDLYLSNAIRLDNATLQEINGTDPFLSGNAYYNGSTWNYLTSTDATNYYQADGQHIWRYAASGTADAAISWSEAMRIDSSGNLLVGKSDDNFGTVGTAISQLGEIQTTRADATPLYVRRNGNNGELIGFYNDNLAAGSIGTVGAQSYIHGGGTDVGIYFGSNNLYPYRQAGLNDATIDLGQSSKRFKDLYLSGGVYLGGTGSANKLDDYEVGTWSPSLQSPPGGISIAGSVHNKYVKVGNIVHLQCYIALNTSSTSTAALMIGNLPFTPLTNQATSGSMIVRYGSSNTYAPYISGARIEFYRVDNTGNWALMNYSNVSQFHAHIGITYQT